MSNTEPVQEPSMEEILASIRKIISDDDSGEGEQQGGDESVIAEEEEAPDIAAVIESVDPASIADAEPVEIEEPAVVEDPSAIQQPEEKAVEEPPVLVADEVPAMISEPDTANAEQADEEVLELGEELALDAESDETAVDITMDQEDPGIETPEMVESDDVIEFGETAEETGPATEIEASEPAPVTDKKLVSEGQGTNIASAFGSLENLVLANEEKTLDGLVREMLKPMLKDWLDANLSPLVDRMVRDEIERVSRGRR